MAGSNHELPHISLQLLGVVKKNDEERVLGEIWNLVGLLRDGEH